MVLFLFLFFCFCFCFSALIFFCSVISSLLPLSNNGFPCAHEKSCFTMARPLPAVQVPPFPSFLQKLVLKKKCTHLSYSNFLPKQSDLNQLEYRLDLSSSHQTAATGCSSPQIVVHFGMPQRENLIDPLHC